MYTNLFISQIFKKTSFLLRNDTIKHIKDQLPSLRKLFIKKLEENAS